MKVLFLLAPLVEEGETAPEVGGAEEECAPGDRDDDDAAAAALAATAAATDEDVNPSPA